MSSEKFHNTSITIKGLLGLIEAKDIAIPEIQRPFVWKNSQVRDLIDSLYKGYPTGYIILWKNPNVKLKDGTISSGKKVIIDGQQRITALMTAIAAQKVFNNEFKESRVKIAFNPFAALEYAKGNSEAEMFAVQTPAHIKSKNWIPDISEIFSTKFSSWTFIPKYIEENPEMSGNDLQQVLDLLKSVETTQIGVIELSEKLDIDVVTDIFIYLNIHSTTMLSSHVLSQGRSDCGHSFFCYLLLCCSLFREKGRRRQKERVTSFAFARTLSVILPSNLLSKHFQKAFQAGVRVRAPERVARLLQ